MNRNPSQITHHLMIMVIIVIHAEMTHVNAVMILIMNMIAHSTPGSTSN
jgi:hypothetical protein